MTRKCDRCSRIYHRRNVVEAWTKQNPGSRLGWAKQIERICLHCQNAKNAQEIVRVFHAAHAPRKEG